MQHRMLCPADIQIDAAGFAAAHPVFFSRFANKAFAVLRIAVTQVVPARARPLRHGVEFTRCRFSVAHPVGGFGKWRFGGAGRAEIFQCRRQQWQLTFRNAAMHAIFPHQREWLAPIALTAEEPVTQFEVHGAFAEAFFFEPGGDILFGSVRTNAIEIEIFIGGMHTNTWQAKWLIHFKRFRAVGKASMSFKHSCLLL